MFPESVGAFVYDLLLSHRDETTLSTSQESFSVPHPSGRSSSSSKCTSTFPKLWSLSSFNQGPPPSDSSTSPPVHDGFLLTGSQPQCKNFNPFAHGRPSKSSKIYVPPTNACLTCKGPSQRTASECFV